MAASGITPQKNFQWIVRNAQYNVDEQYVIVGAKDRSTVNDVQNLKNVFYTGRVSDAELKALMANCKAFIHPAIYEGFGLTPMEAMGAGCKQVIVAKASCLPEIYGDSVHYIDPEDANVKIDELLDEPLRVSTDNLLEKYSWKNSANQLLDLLKSMEK